MIPPNDTPFYLVLDQGTSATKIFVFDDQQIIRFSDRIKHNLQRPVEHHVESDPAAILTACRQLIANALDFITRNNGKAIRAGIAAQRSTFLFWDKVTLKPLTAAISWQDSRARAVANEFSAYGDRITEITGTPLSAHFGAPKYLHFIRQDDHLKQQTQNGTAWFGPLSSFITHSLTGLATVDESIAGRSLLMNLDRVCWDDELCALFGVPLACLPSLSPTVGDFGQITLNKDRIPLSCVIGDQQAALIGQGGLKPGALAMNFGTSGSVLFNSGSKPLHSRGLLSNVLMSYNGTRQYMLEGTINACNSLFYWLETELDIPHHEMQWHKRCAGQTTEGVFVPGFVGLAAPYWKDGFETIKHNLEQASENEIIRAAMESIGLLTYDIFERIKEQLAVDTKMVTTSGGGIRPPLMQFLADLLGVTVGHTSMRDRTALGVYKLLRLAEGQDITSQQVDCDRIYSPKMDEATRKAKFNRWHRTLEEVGIR